MTPRALWVGFFVCLLALSGIRKAHAQQSVPEAFGGLWLAQAHDGVFQMQMCQGKVGPELCGRLVGMQYEGAVPKDVWGRNQCGLVMLYGFHLGKIEGRWDGQILDPQTGHVYTARIWSPSQGVLKLHGYILGMPILGETQTWTQYRGKVGKDCTMLP